MAGGDYETVGNRETSSRLLPCDFEIDGAARSDTSATSQYTGARD